MAMWLPLLLNVTLLERSSLAILYKVLLAFHFLLFCFILHGREKLTSLEYLARISPWTSYFIKSLRKACQLGMSTFSFLKEMTEAQEKGEE